MNTGIVNIIMLLVALLISGGCSTTAAQQVGHTADRPILSAAEAKSMIRVEVRVLRPPSIEDTVVASAD